MVAVLVWRRRSRKRHLFLSNSTRRLTTSGNRPHIHVADSMVASFSTCRWFIAEIENPTFTANVDQAVTSQYAIDGPEHEPTDVGIYADPLLTTATSLPNTTGYLQPCDDGNTLSKDCPVSAGGYLAPVEEHTYDQPFAKVCLHSLKLVICMIHLFRRTMQTLTTGNRVVRNQKSTHNSTRTTLLSLGEMHSS